MERFSDFVTPEDDVGAGTATGAGGGHAIALDPESTDESESGVENRISIHLVGDST